MQGLVMTVIAVFGVQHVCDFFGLSSSVTIIAQILCFFILPRFLGGASKSIVGEKAPPISDLQYVQGEPVELGNGKVTVVEFWATWCPPCRTSIPHLNEVYRKFKDQGVDFVGVTNEDESTVKKFMEKMGPDFTYPSALDRSGSVSRGYPVCCELHPCQSRTRHRTSGRNCGYASVHGRSLAFLQPSSWERMASCLGRDTQ